MDPTHSQQARSGQPSRLLPVLSNSLTQQTSNPRSSFSSVRYTPLEIAVDEKKADDSPARLSIGQRVDPCASCQCAHCVSAAPSASVPTRSLSVHPVSIHHAHQTSPFLATSPHAVSSWTAPTPAYARPRGLRIANLLKPWIPIILYAVTSLGFVAALSFWKVQVFQGMILLTHVTHGY